MLHPWPSCIVPGGPIGSRSGHGPCSREKGLTLVELLIAVALLGFILLGIAPLFIASVKSNYSGNEYTSVNMLARDRLEGLMNLSFTNTQLDVGIHPTAADPVQHLLPLSLPDPQDPTKLSKAQNPFTLTYEVTQWQIPDAGPTDGTPLVISNGLAFTPIRVKGFGLIYQHKRIDVEVRSEKGPLGIGARVARVSGYLTNPNPQVNLSQIDPVP
jgi:prepilin-type N-terminal cleavage/methylation domain-containing protein